MSPALSNEANKKITWIKKEYREIRDNLDKYKEEGFDFLGESTEGAGGVGYISENGEIKLIEVTYYGEMGKSYYEFYYSNNNTFFIFNKHYKYNTHFSMTKEVVEDWYKQDGVRQEVFDLSKTKIEEWRYYFYENKVIKTLGPKGTVILDSSNAESALESSLSNYKRLNKQIQPTPKSGAAD